MFSKKLKSVSAVVALSLALAGCSTSTNKDQEKSSLPTASPSAPVEIEFWHALSGDLMTKMVDEYNKSQSKVKVTPVFVQNNYEGIVEKLQVQAAAKKLPDVSLNGLLYTRFASETVHAVPLEPFIQRDGYNTNDFFPNMLALGKDEKGKQIGLPFGISTPILYFNADKLREAGLNPDNMPKTWEELPKVAKELTRNGKFGLTMSIDWAWLYQAMMETYGGSMMAKDGKSVGLDSPESIRAVQTIVDMALKDKSLPVVPNYGESINTMIKGDAAMLITSTAALSSVGGTAKYDLRTALYPTFGGKRTVPAGGSNLMIFTTDKAKQDASWDFIKYITDKQRSIQIAQAMGYMVTTKSALEDPSMKAYLDKNPNYKTTYSQVDQMVPWFNFPGTGGTKIQKIITDQIQAALQGQKAPEEAMKEAAKQANALIH
ncbi:hypothetical protein A8709_02975 [Paenibacillus pectinilyticus]|uniref:ABC transporter substrate-binding protein n=1 Tax=Paenibacillus pectinilyticus TaxID=512399 RepID=A0A1C1A771_9BACL|nr:ABC transporter substrate-binding protein [Paenibacillus pectinilyticus]OCT16407.1 hypothetical protein A8709_02975 [Paenibacillus pectinilyticus]